jgi:nitrite reductase (cytochrome c-552)
LNKSQKSLIALLSVLLLFFGFVIVRVGAIKPASTVKVAKIPAGEYDPAVWGQYYPLQYASFKKNAEMAPSPGGYGGSMKVQNSEKQPEILMDFKGYPFSIDYTEDRGHVYSIQDIKETKRIGPKSVGACITCKTPYLEKIYKESGWDYAKAPFAEILAKVPDHGYISCANCHDQETMNLRVINPAFIEAQQRRGIDVTKASREDMRTYVCAQCHVEYYFEPGTSRVVFPWDKGLKPDQIYAYYEEKPKGFAQDWQHPDSKAAMLKTQHPEYETWATGVHGKAGVSCADCHMPYMRKDGQKYTSHWMTSPLRTLDASCSSCHTQGSDWLQERVKTIQDHSWQLQHTAGLTVAQAHEAIKKAGEIPNVDQAELAKARELVRKAQWFWDFVAAENSMGFHNPDQVLNTSGQAIDLANQAIQAAYKAAGIEFQ